MDRMTYWKKRYLAGLTALAVMTTASCGQVGESMKTTTDASSEPQVSLSSEVESSDINEPTPQTEIRRGDHAALAGPEYPDMAPYPDAGDSSDQANFQAKYDAWQADHLKQVAYKDRIQISFTPYIKGMAQEIFQDKSVANHLFSPTSLYLALGMLVETTDDEASAEILEMLGVETKQELRQIAEALWQSNYCKDGRFTSEMSQSIWLKDGFPANQTTLDQLASTYMAYTFEGETGSEAYDEQLQTWINEHTGGLLEEAASNLNMKESTVMMLVSTLYFKARWEDTFDDDLTDRSFYGRDEEKSVPFMHVREETRIHREQGFTAVEKPFEGDGAMWFFLPEEGKDLYELLDEAPFYEVLERAKSETSEEGERVMLDLNLPKFDIASAYNLNKHVMNLGVEKIFEPSMTHFQPLMDPGAEPWELFVSLIRQASRVIVDQEGVEAASFTSISIDATSARELEKLELTFDRPFLYAITGQTGDVLFIGSYQQP